MYLMYKEGFKGNKEESRSLLYEAIEKYCVRTGNPASGRIYGAHAMKIYGKGKPYIEGFADFSISHTDSLWCVIFSDSPCGIDVQAAKTGNLEKMAIRVFEADDAAKVRIHGEQAFFKLWCRKEAYIKAIGESIFSEVPSLWSEGDSTFVGGFFVRDVELFDGYFSAICVKGFGRDFKIVKVKL